MNKFILPAHKFSLKLKNKHNRCRWSTVEWFHIHMEMLLPGGKMWLLEDTHLDNMYHLVMLCSLLKQSVMKYYSNNYSNYWKIFHILRTLKDTVSFIMFNNILQAKELNKGQIKYHTFYEESIKVKAFWVLVCSQICSAKLCQCRALQV